MAIEITFTSWEAFDKAILPLTQFIINTDASTQETTNGEMGNPIQA